MMSFLLRALLSAIAVAIATVLSGAVTQFLFGDLGIPQPKSDPWLWQLAAWLVTGLTLAWIGSRSRSDGWRLGASLAILVFGISHFSSIVEARFFGLLDARQFLVILTMSVVSAAFLALGLTAAYARVGPGLEPEWGTRLTPGRVAVGAIAYVVTYFAAGMAVFPYVRSFYEGRTMPSGLGVIGVQLIIRGPLFVALAALLLRLSCARRGESIVMTGSTLAILGGVVTLMVPNALIPDTVRWAHFIEVVMSNFVYGCFLGWLLTSRRADAVEVTSPAAAPAA